MQLLASDFERKINWNRHQSKNKNNKKAESIFKVPNWSMFSKSKKTFFALLFKTNAVRTTYTRYFLARVEIKEYNVMIDEKYCLHQPAKGDMGT